MDKETALRYRKARLKGLTKRYEKSLSDYNSLDNKPLCNAPDCNNEVPFSKSIHRAIPLKYCSKSCASRSYEHMNEIHNDRASLSKVGKLIRASQNGRILTEDFRRLYKMFNYTGISSKMFIPPKIASLEVSQLSGINHQTLKSFLSDKRKMTVGYDSAHKILSAIGRGNPRYKKPKRMHLVESEILYRLRIAQDRIARKVDTLLYVMDKNEDFITNEKIEMQKLQFIINDYLQKYKDVTPKILDTKLGLEKDAVDTILNDQYLQYVNADLVRHVCNRLIGYPTNSTKYERISLSTGIE